MYQINNKLENKTAVVKPIIRSNYGQVHGTGVEPTILFKQLAYQKRLFSKFISTTSPDTKYYLLIISILIIIKYDIQAYFNL